jgi:hypothetical protein
MVNIRRTLGQAAAAGVISQATLLRLQEIGKALFYADRRYPELLRRAAGVVPERELTGLGAWLPTGRADQKRDDAVAMLRAMGEAAGTGPAPRPSFNFAYTEYWDRIRTNATARAIGAGEGDEDLAPVLQELEGSEQEQRDARAAALLRALGLQKARRHGITANADAVQAEAAHLADRIAPEALPDWLRRQRLDEGGLDRLLAEEALLRRVVALMEPDITGALPDHLRITGSYGRLLARARARRGEAAETPPPDQP